MSDRPPDNEYTRRSDVKNKKLPPSVRAMNYAKALVTAWPVVLGLVGLLGYTNADEIKQFYQKVEIEEADGQTEVASGGMTFEESVEKFTKETRKEIEEIKATAERIRTQLAGTDSSNYTKLQEQLKAIDLRLQDIEEIVQP